MWLKCPILRGTGRVAYDTVVQLKCDARLQSEKQGILGNGVVEMFTRRVSHRAEAMVRAQNLKMMWTVE